MGPFRKKIYPQSTLSGATLYSNLPIRHPSVMLQREPFENKVANKFKNLKTLNEFNCVKSVTQHFSVFSPNIGEYGPENL